MKIGVDFGGTNSRAGLVLHGRIVKKVSRKTQADLGKKVSLANLISVIEDIFDKRVKGIGIAFPAPVDIEKGFIYETSNLPGWRDVHIRKIIEKRFGVPCFINNDANCFTLAEHVFGQGKDIENIVGITLGTGIGTGAVIHSKLYNGNSNSVAELVKIPYKEASVEDFVNARFLEKNGRRNPEELAELAAKGDVFAKDVFKIYGKNLGVALSIIVNTLDPQIIVIGGGLSGSFQFFEKAMLKELKEYCYTHAFKRLKVVRSTLKDANILGAACLVEN